MIITPSSTITRPADTTAYAPADLVANSTTSVSVVPLAWAIKPVASNGTIRRMRLWKSTSTVLAATFRVHLFSSFPTVTNGDNGALALSSAGAYLDAVSFDLSTGALVYGGQAFKASATTSIGFAMPNSKSPIYGLIEALGAYAPGSAEQFAVTLEIEQN